MNKTPRRVARPQAALISVEELRAYLRVDHGDDDALIQSYIDAAVAHLDGYSGILGRCLINQAWQLRFANWEQCLRLPFPDIQSISEITYEDASEVTQTVDSAFYDLHADTLSPFVRLRSVFPFPDLESGHPSPISVTFVAGYGANVYDVPSTILQFIRLCVGAFYENRGDDPKSDSDVFARYSSFLAPHRDVRI